MNPDKWTQVDSAIDDVLRKVRGAKQNAGETTASLEALLQAMNTLAEHKPQPTLAEPSQPALPKPKQPTPAAAAKPLGDLSTFRGIAESLLRLVRAGDAAHAKARATDLETAWDEAESRLRPMSPAQWTAMDDAIDEVLRKVRSVPLAMAPDRSKV